MNPTDTKTPAHDQILFLTINLPGSVERRKAILAQAERFHLDLHIVPAVSGKELTPEQKACYDSKRRLRSYSQDLLANEQACVHSHRRALKTFLDSDPARYKYMVVLEDDAMLAPFFNEGIEELTRHITGWECAKLYMGLGPLYDLLPHCEEAPVQPVFPKGIPWGAVGYMFTRTAARILYDDMQTFWLAADAQIGHILLHRRIPIIGTRPSMLLYFDPETDVSDIDKNRDREKHSPRTLLQYITYRLEICVTSWRKKRLRALMQRLIKRIP